jgi:hypothetical protein
VLMQVLLLLFRWRCWCRHCCMQCRHVVVHNLQVERASLGLEVGLAHVS